MRIYYIYLLNTNRDAVTPWLDTHYRHCSVTYTYVLDNASGQHPLLYLDWYPPESFAREWDETALQTLRNRLGAGFEQTTLLAYLSNAYGREEDAQQFATQLLATFAGLAEDADGQLLLDTTKRETNT